MFTLIYSDCSSHNAVGYKGIWTMNVTEYPVHSPEAAPALVHALVHRAIINWPTNEVRGHPFMTSTKNQAFDPLPCPHAYTWAGPPFPPCGRPHAVDMKYTPLSLNG